MSSIINLIINRGKQSRVELLYIGSILLFTLFFYTYYLFREPLVYGIDGPYYLLQIEWLSTHGYMYYGDPPLTFYLLYPLYAFIGDSTLAVKIFVLFIISASTLLIYYSLRRLLNVDKFSASVISLIYAFSPNMVRMCGDFVKNVFGLQLLILYLIFMIYYSRCNTGLRGFIILYVIGLSVLLTHILAYGMLFAYTVILLITLFRHGWRNSLYLLLLIVLFTVTSFIAYYLDPFHFNDLGKIMYYTRLGQNPSLRNPPLPRRLPFIIDIIYLLIPLYALSSALSVILYTLLRRLDYSTWLFINTIMLIIMVNPFLEHQVFIRLVYASILPAVYVLGILLSCIEQYIHRVSIGFGLLVITLIMGLLVASTWGPVISYEEYKELRYIEQNVIKTTTKYYVIPRGIPRYWAQYIFGLQHVKPYPIMDPGCINYIIFSKKYYIPPLKPGEKIIYDGRYFQVRVIVKPYIMQ